MSVGFSSTTKFVPNAAGIAELKRSKKTQDAMLDVARAIARRTASNGGRYNKGMRAVRTGPGKARAGTDYKNFHWAEWGTIHHAPTSPMRRALSSLGLWDQTKEASKP